MLKRATIAAVLALIGGACSSAAPSWAVPFGMSRAASLFAASPNIELTGAHKVYPRSIYRHGPYIYYHRGFWYLVPWWYGTGFREEVDTGYDTYGGAYDDYNLAEGDWADLSGDEHIRWCLKQYHSYDPNSDTYVAHDGFRHTCNSPFD